MPTPDQHYYDVVGEELAQKVIKPGLWARALAETGSDDSRARSRYIVLRVAELEEEDFGQDAAEDSPAEQAPRSAGTAEHSSSSLEKQRRIPSVTPGPITPLRSRIFPERLDRFQYFWRWSIFEFLRYAPFIVPMALPAVFHVRGQTMEAIPDAVVLTFLILAIVFNVALLIWRMMAIDIPRIRSIGWSYTTVILLAVPVANIVMQVLLLGRPSRSVPEC